MNKIEKIERIIELKRLLDIDLELVIIGDMNLDIDKLWETINKILK